MIKDGVFRAGLIGCGNIGARYDEKPGLEQVYTHAGMYRATSGLELVCACDLDPDRIDAFADYWGVNRTYTDPLLMLEKEKLDILSIATPDETHHDLIMSVLNNNPPRIIFCEKPLGKDSTSVGNLVAACQESKVELIVDYVRRWDDSHRKLRALILSGGLGEIRSVTGYYVRGLRHNGCQMINLLRFLFGGTIEVQALGNPEGGSFPGDPSIAFRLSLCRAPQVYVIPLDRNGYDYSIYEVDIFSEKGRLRILDGGAHFTFQPIISDGAFSNFLKLGDVEDIFPSTYAESFLSAGKEFVSFLSGSAGDLSNRGDEAYRDQLVIEAVISSSRNNNMITTVIK